MFIDSKVNHKKYGKGTITNLEINPENELKSKVTIDFESGVYSKKFPIDIFGDTKFATINDDKAVEYVSSLRKEEEEKKAKKLEEARKKREQEIYIPSYNLDEIEKEVSVEDWKKAASVAGKYRFPNESRAVVMDSDLVFINAAAAMRYIESRAKDGDKLYKSCDINRKFMGHHWSYASKETVEAIIAKIED